MRGRRAVGGSSQRKAFNCLGARRWKGPPMIRVNVVGSWRRGSLRRRQKRTGDRLPSEVAWCDLKFASLLKIAVPQREEGCGFRNVFRLHIERRCLVEGGCVPLMLHLWSSAAILSQAEA